MKSKAVFNVIKHRVYLRTKGFEEGIVCDELLARVPAECKQHGFMSSNFINSPLHGEPTCHDLSGVADSPVSPVEDESPGGKNNTSVIGTPKVYQ